MDKTIHLLSSGLDSPVAACLLVKASIEPVFLFFDARPFNTLKTRETAIKLARKISGLAGKPLVMHVAPHGATLKAIQAAWSFRELKYTCIFCKRVYYMVAKALALREGAIAVSTGEIIGEQASQTIDNLALIQDAVGNFLVFRPLLCVDKVDVIAMAREFGTFDISSEAKDPCRAVPRYPMTHGKIDAYAPIEAKVDVQAIVARVLSELETFKVDP